MADCLCGHAKRDHRNTISGGRVRPYCVRCDGCRGFGMVEPDLPRALLEQPVDEVMAAVDRSERRLILAWDTRWCPTCSSRYLSEDAVCCGARCVAVRIEMYERGG